MKVAVVLVHYHTPELLTPAVAALVRDAAVSGIELEGVIVDNGSRPEDREALETSPFRYLSPGGNLGYAGGVNLGLAATSAEATVVMNPDVLVRAGCLEALVAALDGGAWAAGPRFFWDEDRTWILPPTERAGRWPTLLSILAESGAGWARWARARWRQHARSHWQATQELTTWDLSGAMLAARREAWRRVGPMDEGFRLYFEETDWLQRLRRLRREARLVPRAEAIHLYAQSTARESRAEAWFRASSRRFRRRFHGPAFDTLACRLARRSLAPPKNISSLDPPDDPSCWVEVSPSAKGFPAAGRPPGHGTESLFSPPLRQRLGKGTYWIRQVTERGDETRLTKYEHLAGQDQ